MTDVIVMMAFGVLCLTLGWVLGRMHGHDDGVAEGWNTLAYMLNERARQQRATVDALNYMDTIKGRSRRWMLVK